MVMLLYIVSFAFIDIPCLHQVEFVIHDNQSPGVEMVVLDGIEVGSTHTMTFSLDSQIGAADFCSHGTLQ